jgi:glycosyltransferase involved in cell wall biosynthesis
MISVVLCTHDPRPDYLGRTLEGLRAQTLAPGSWELLVVDNRSEPPLSGRLDLTGLPGARIVREDTLGLTPARLRAIAEAGGRLLVFVDDDNVLDPDYLERAAAVADGSPHLGAWSGQCRPQFESSPPEWTRRYWGNLVIREFDRDVWSNLPRLAQTMPCGAGLCVRREVARRYLQLHEAGQRKVQLDRTGESLLSGGDNDLAACACDLGLGVGLISALRLTHQIPPARLTRDYLVRLAYGIAYSGALLDDARGVALPGRSRARRLVDGIRLMLLREPHRSIQQAVLRARKDAERMLAQMAGTSG